MVKLNDNGNIQWDKTVGGNEDDYLMSLQQTGDGGYILGGYSWSNKSGEKTENSRGYSDYWVVKLNSTGKIQWDQTIGGSNYDVLFSLQQISDGGFILGGSSRSDKSGDKTENSRGWDDYWVVKLNDNGNIQWDKTIGGNYNDWCFSIKEIGKNRYVIGGSSDSEISGDKKRRSRGWFDYWLVALNDRKDTTIISSQNTQSLLKPTIAHHKSFTVYPNPAKDILHIQTNSKAILSLTNQSGKILLSKTITGKGEINVAQLPPGLYYLKNNTTGAVQKVVVSK